MYSVSQGCEILSFAIEVKYDHRCMHSVRLVNLWKAKLVRILFC